MFKIFNFKSLIKKIIPLSLLIFYHQVLALVYAWWYKHPSNFLVVIGVTGTNGKSTVVSFISQLLTSLGYKTGYASTAEFKIGDSLTLNDQKMTMLGRGRLQRMLREMVATQTDYAIIETSSEGIAQSRHRGIAYDLAVFTNLTPEHIESHGSFASYKAAKLELFSYLSSLPPKVIRGKKIAKSIIVNADDKHATDFLNFVVDKKIRYLIDDEVKSFNSDLVARQVLLQEQKTVFLAQGQEFVLPVPGKFNVYNTLSAMSVLLALDIPLSKMVAPVAKLTAVPGRLEFISEGQPFKVIVDYAYEPVALQALYESLSLFQFSRLIHVLGSAGGGRDKSRRKILGRLAGRKAKIVIVTNEDPYDEDPETIIKEVAAGASSVGKQAGKDLLMIIDRKEAIAAALEQARPGDLVLITGKGSEQAIMGSRGSRESWDDRKVTRELLQKIIVHR